METVDVSATRPILEQNSDFQVHGLERIRRGASKAAFLLRANNVDWGPKPFRILNCWLTDKSFREVVNQCWNSVQVSGWGAYVLKEKNQKAEMQTKDMEQGRIWG